MKSGVLRILGGFLLTAVVLLAKGELVSQAELRSAATKSIELLNKVNQTWLKQSYCYSCHADGHFNKLHQIARRHGLPVDEAIALRSARRSYGWMSNADEAIQGVYFVDPTLVDGHKLIAAHDAGYPATLPLAAYARRLARLQTPQGNWISSDRRPPQSHSQWSATEVSIEAIRYYLPERLNEDRRRIFAKAIQWLTTARPESTEDRANQVLALAKADAPNAVIQKAAAKLLAEQRPDGGWAQIAHRESDSYATGLALYALHEGGAVNVRSAAYQRGLRYLLDSQKTDGTWHVRTRLVYPIPISPPKMETGFPYGNDQIISTMGTVLSTIAIALAVDPPAVAAQPYGGQALLTQSPAATPEWLEIALFGSAKELQALLDRGLDPNVTTAGGTPLLLVVSPEPDKLRLVAGRVKDVNVRAPRTNFTALMVAAAHTNTADSVKILLRAGAKVSFGNADTSIPPALLLASGTAEPAKAQLLLDHGASLREIWTRNGSVYTVLGNAVDLHDQELIRLLVKAGAPVNPAPPAHLTPLARAVTSNQRDVVQLLISLGADVNQADGNGIRPLEYAAMSDYGDPAVVKLLLAAGARPDVRSADGLTPTEIAKKHRRDYLLQLLAVK